VKNRNGVDILYDDTVLQRQEVLWVKQNEQYIVDWQFKVLLQSNQYTIAVVISIPINLDIAEVDMCDFIPIAAQFVVESRNEHVYSAMFANSKLLIEKQ
jgi:lipopolysaccharide transport system ATP-binding protein